MAPPDAGAAAACGARWVRRDTLLGLALGQFVSLLITATGFASSELARRGINAPTSQSLLNYVLLAVAYGGVLLYRRQPLTIKWYYYLILGIIDVEANYIVVKSYQYTSLTSVMLLDCWSIPCVILLTWVFLKTKYGARKFLGVGVCVLGLILVVFSDVHASDRAKGPNPLKGDLFVILGSMLYACSNVTEEFVIKKSNRVELMAMLGLFGALISAIQISVLEREELHSITWTSGAVLPFLGFAVAMFLFYSAVPVILKLCGATMLNLSLLTSDMWAVLIRIFAYHEKVDWIYFVAFAATAGGIVLYSYRYVSFCHHFTATVLATTEYYGCIVLAQHERPGFARSGSNEVEETAQVAGASDEHGKGRDEEAGTRNPA
ncbi:Anthocyanin-related membrane protein 1 (Anm1)-like [Zea mays]|uniref:Anthocyanin-related membrane protein 1 (Anm1)-like n=1 Tax=Zea mays TaxID=4577 RepID=A0A1D6QIZ6_MAIZE|nr:Anthocyanin-related membrane protein 1 (Anm1)-like [Zea mays]